MSNKYTPGPWKVFNAWNAANGVIAFSRIGNDEKSVIRSENTQADIYASNEANLHLICTAPELLEALENTLWVLDYDRSRERIQSQKKYIASVIAKAKGEQ